MLLCVVARIRVEQRASRDELEQHHPEGPHVERGLRWQRLPAGPQQLRRRIRRAALRARRLAEGHGGVQVDELPRHADAHRVERLDVAVHHAAAVELTQCLRQLPCHVAHHEPLRGDAGEALVQHRHRQVALRSGEHDAELVRGERFVRATLRMPARGVRRAGVLSALVRAQNRKDSGLVSVSEMSPRIQLAVEVRALLHALERHAPG